MIDREKRIEALEEAVRQLESIKAHGTQIGDLDFDDARVDSYVGTALSATRAALSATTKLDEPEDARRD